jgi:hypothetical protein
MIGPAIAANMPGSALIISLLRCLAVSVGSPAGSSASMPSAASRLILSSRAANSVRMPSLHRSSLA